MVNCLQFLPRVGRGVEGAGVAAAAADELELELGASWQAMMF